MGPLRVAVLVIGVALSIGFLTAGVGEDVKLGPGPAVLQPASDSRVPKPVQLRLREVSMPTTLRPASRPKPKRSRETSSEDTTPAPSSSKQPSSPSRSFDSVG